MERLIAGPMAFVMMASPAASQTLTSPPDMGTYVARSVTYAAGSADNVLGDASNAKGGVAPAFSTHPEPAEPTPTVPTGYIVNTAIDACVTTNGDPSLPGSCNNKKARFGANASHILNDDPFRYWGQPGASHCHEFFGNAGVNAFSTNMSLRYRNASTFSGGPAWSTAYWRPCVLKVIGGKTYAIRSIYNTVYYNEEVAQGQPIVDDLQTLHALLGFIAGVNMDDPDDNSRKAEVAAANAQSGTAGRYSFLGNGFLGYQCITPGVNGQAVPLASGAEYAPGFRLGPASLDASDPWYTGGVHRCGVGYIIRTNLTSPPYWDGANPKAPGGYDNFRQPIQDNVKGKPVGPNGWYKVPTAQFKEDHMTQGWDDYKTWYLSSDMMMQMKLDAIAAAGGPASHTVLPGGSLHADWANGINRTVRDQALGYCLGVNTNTPHGCNYSTIGATQRLITDSNSPDGKRKPQVNGNLSINSNDPSQLTLVSDRQMSHGGRGN